MIQPAGSIRSRLLSCHVVCAERATHPPTESLVFRLVGRSTRSIFCLTIFLGYFLESYTKREQIKPKDFGVIFLYLYGFPLHSFAFSSIASTRYPKKAGSTVLLSVLRINSVAYLVEVLLRSSDDRVWCDFLLVNSLLSPWQLVLCREKVLLMSDFRVCL